MGGQIGVMLDSFFYGFDTALYSFFWMFQNSVTIGIADICQYMGNTAAFIICFALLVLLCIPKKTKKFGVAMTVAFLVAFLLVNVLIKPGVGRLRPYMTLKDTPFWETYQTHWINAGANLEDDLSFPSGHTSMNFAVFTALSAVLIKVRKKPAWLLLMFIPVVVGCTRIIRCVHYPSDVLVGMLIGIASGICGYLVARHFFLEKEFPAIETDHL
ncbi:MAG: phosphatase PAP2 family protein [Firmicutes bacterium]|nr:phosphatase PAP2 family protein [Bacillota bacterium]